MFLAGLGLLFFCSLGNPFICKDSIGPVAVFFTAAALSLVGFLVYAVGLRTFLRDYENADVRFVFLPVCVSALLGIVAPIVIIVLFKLIYPFI